MRGCQHSDRAHRQARHLEARLLHRRRDRQRREAVVAPVYGVLASIRACESGGNYSANTGNGFYGAYQFTDQTWHAMGGSGHASDAPAAEQDQRASKLMATSGPQNWPVCSR